MVHLRRIAIALVVDDQNRVLMLWRYRFVTQQWGYELLGGLVDEGEDAALRQLGKQRRRAGGVQ